MADLTKAGGDTWNSASDLRATFEELGGQDNTDDENYIYSADLLNAANEKAQYMIEARLRPKWNVDNADYWSSANIDTYAPAVKAVALQWAAGVALLRGLGKGLRGGSAEYAQYLIGDAKEDLTELIENASFGVAKRSDNPDGISIHAGSQGATTPFFTRGDETDQPVAPSSGTRDENPY